MVQVVEVTQWKKWNPCICELCIILARDWQYKHYISVRSGSSFGINLKGVSVHSFPSCQCYSPGCNFIWGYKDKLGLWSHLWKWYPSLGLLYFMVVGAFWWFHNNASHRWTSGIQRCLTVWSGFHVNLNSAAQTRKPVTHLRQGQSLPRECLDV